MKPLLDHPTNCSPAEAIAWQTTMAERVSRAPRLDRRNARWVAGCDVSYSKATDRCYGAVTLWDLRRGEATEEQTSGLDSSFPYVPGLLSFREAPALIDALGRLEREPDLLLLEGHGWAHPRRCGLASHIGLLFDKPAVGCAKKRLCGAHDEPGETRGSRAAIRHRGEVVGLALRTRDRVGPVFVSVGHRVTLDQCARLALRLTAKYRMPAPPRRAHQLSNKARKAYEEDGW